MRYSLGTYVRLTDTVRCSSISLASLRASSTGRTSERKTRPKVPSTGAASLLSRLRRSLIVAPALPAENGLFHREEAVGAAGPCYALGPPPPARTTRASTAATTPASTAPRAWAGATAACVAAANPAAQAVAPTASGARRRPRTSQGR